MLPATAAIMKHFLAPHAGPVYWFAPWYSTSSWPTNYIWWAVYSSWMSMVPTEITVWPIWAILKGLGNEFSHKSSRINLQLFEYLEKQELLWLLLVEHWAAFYSNIWSHWKRIHLHCYLPTYSCNRDYRLLVLGVTSWLMDPHLNKSNRGLHYKDILIIPEST